MHISFNNFRILIDLALDCKKLKLESLITGDLYIPYRAGMYVCRGLSMSVQVKNGRLSFIDNMELKRKLPQLIFPTTPLINMSSLFWLRNLEFCDVKFKGFETFDKILIYLIEQLMKKKSYKSLEFTYLKKSKVESFRVYRTLQGLKFLKFSISSTKKESRLEIFRDLTFEDLKKLIQVPLIFQGFTPILEAPTQDIYIAQLAKYTKITNMKFTLHEGGDIKC